MGWKIKDWICGGFQAKREDGEKIFIYKNLEWAPEECLDEELSYEFHWHGLVAGRMLTGNSWQAQTRIAYVLNEAGTIDEQDLLEISMGILDMLSMSDYSCGQHI